MIHLLIICMIIVGFMILGGGAALVFWAADHYNGFRALLGIIFCFILTYIIITGMVHIIRIYYKLPTLPWEFANTTLMSSL